MAIETELLKAAVAILTSDYQKRPISLDIIVNATDYLLLSLQEGVKELQESIELKKMPAMKPLKEVKELRID